MQTGHSSRAKPCLVGQTLLSRAMIVAPDRVVMRDGLVRWVAVIDAAAQWPAIARRAVPARILPGASLAPIQRPLWLGRAVQQELNLGGRDEERVSILLEAAAAAAQLADRPEPGHFRVELLVQSAQLGGGQRTRAVARSASVAGMSSVISGSSRWTKRSRPRCRGGLGPSRGRSRGRGPNPLASPRFPARTARSGTERDGRDRPCSRLPCPRRCNRRPAFRSGCSGPPLAARTSRANCSTVSPRNSARRAISSGDTQTYPERPCSRPRTACRKTPGHPGTTVPSIPVSSSLARSRCSRRDHSAKVALL